MKFDFDCIIVGCGVIGLSCGKYFTNKGLKTLLIEKEDAIGQGISSRNSEVIHAGIYYQPDSLKARLCRKGNKLLYQYCEEKSILHNRCGKWLVATTKEQFDHLEHLKSLASRNHVSDLNYISIDQARYLEPQLEAKKILVSPSSGIIDSHGLMTALRSDVEMNGGLISLNTSFKHAKAINGGFQISLDGDDYQDYQITSKNFINAAGLNASFVAQNIEGLDQKIIPNTVFAKGHYLKLSKAAPFSRLIYPLPENGSLGIHFTLDLDGNGKFGPDLEWVNREDYSMSNININKFITTIKQYYPSLQNSNLHPDYCGIRPKLGSKNNFAKDFFIQTFSEHGINGLVNLYGIESPGLTSSLALPEEISKHIND